MSVAIAKFVAFNSVLPLFDMGTDLKAFFFYMSAVLNWICSGVVWNCHFSQKDISWNFLQIGMNLLQECVKTFRERSDIWRTSWTLKMKLIYMSWTGHVSLILMTSRHFEYKVCFFWILWVWGDTAGASCPQSLLEENPMWTLDSNIRE